MYNTVTKLFSQNYQTVQDPDCTLSCFKHWYNQINGDEILIWAGFILVCEKKRDCEVTQMT